MQERLTQIGSLSALDHFTLFDCLLGLCLDKVFTDCVVIFPRPDLRCAHAAPSMLVSLDMSLGHSPGLIRAEGNFSQYWMMLRMLSLGYTRKVRSPVGVCFAFAHASTKEHARILAKVTTLFHAFLCHPRSRYFLFLLLHALAHKHNTSTELYLNVCERRGLFLKFQ